MLIDSYRLINFLSSITLLLITIPLMILISLALMLFQGFPIFFIQKRIGKDGSGFRMLKFRTMLPRGSAEENDDLSRVTKLGRMLRRSSLDELPQLFNVLKGEMNLVGPRPLPIEYLPQFNKWQSQRFLVKPGITGLAQIKGRNLLSWRQKFRFDVWYVQHKTASLDLWILCNTARVIMTGHGILTSHRQLPSVFNGKS